MRILMLSWRGPFHPLRGGAEVYTEQLLRGLGERGHTITWYSAGFASVGRPENLAPNIRLEYGVRGLAVYLSGHHWGTAHAREFDVIIDQINTFGFRMPVEGPTPVVALIHQVAEDVWDTTMRWPINVIGRRVEHFVLDHYRRHPFITVSASTLNDVRARGWRGRGFIVQNTTQVRARFSKSPQPTLSFVGRFNHPTKRASHAIQILKDVRREFPHAELWIIGRGTPPPQAHWEPGVRYFPDVTDAERDRLVGQSWICVATSVREGWGRMVTEAAAVGTPAVVYAVPGLRDAVVDQETGLIVPANPAEAAAAIRDLFRDLPKLELLARTARDRVTKWTIDHAVDAVEKILDKLTDDRSYGGVSC